MFKVPEWGNDIPKSTVDVAKAFKKKNKEKKKPQSNKDLNTSTNTVNKKLNGVSKRKGKFGKNGKNVRGPVISKQFNNNVGKKNKPGQFVARTNKNDSQSVNKSNGSTTQNTNQNGKPVANKKGLKRKQKPKKGKPKPIVITTNSEKTESEDADKSNATITSETSTNDNTSNVVSKKKANKRKLKDVPLKGDKTADVEIQNFDTDEPDKLLLNAKRKKYNEKIESDDIEDELFNTYSPKSEKKGKGKKQNQVSISEKAKKQIQLPQGKNAAKGNKQNQLPVSEKGFKTNKKNLVPASDQMVEEAEEKVVVKEDRKKQAIKAMLQKSDSKRNPIDVSGNTLRQRMLDRLKAAQFRFLNEKLYTSSGAEAQELFKEDPAAFEVYHEGYQQQVKKWPVNPLDIIVQRIQKMPKTHLIADMGCGEAALSQRVPNSVRSFDLVARGPGVEPCDMARTPLLTASMDAVVYCLALMGTDLTRYLLEANRVLKIGGHLLIAEVESRFDNADTFASDVQRLGFSLKKIDKTHKVFFFMEFTKVRDPPAKKNKLPQLSLKPCLYKRR